MNTPEKPIYLSATRSRRSILYMVLFTISVCVTLILFGAYRNVIAGYDYTKGESSGPSARQTIILVGSFFFCLVLFASRLIVVARLAARCWPLYVMPLLAVISAVWSVDPGLTIARGSILLAVYISFLGIAGFLGQRGTYSLFYYTGGAFAVLSIFTALVFPSIGVHQLSDAVQKVHAGEWRGVLGHRTGLGQFSALFIIFLVAYRSYVSKIGLFFPLLMTTLCLLMANSTGGYITCFLGVFGLLVLERAARLGANAFKAVSATLLTCVLFIAAVTTSSDLDFLSLIGKDADLTGRTPLWKMIREAVGDSWIMGLGYNSGFQLIASSAVFNIRYSVTPNSQSAYLDIYVAFGAVGLTLIILSWYRLIFMVGGRISTERRLTYNLKDREKGLFAFTAVLVIMVAQISLVESFYMESNNTITGALSLLVPASFLFALNQTKQTAVMPQRRPTPLTSEQDYS